MWIGFGPFSGPVISIGHLGHHRKSRGAFLPAPHDNAGAPVTEHADECGNGDKARKREKGSDRLGLFHAVYLVPKPAQLSSTAGLAETVARKAFGASQPEKGPTVIREEPKKGTVPNCLSRPKPR